LPLLSEFPALLSALSLRSVASTTSICGTDIANFAFYFVVAWLLQKAFGRSKTLVT
jgi:hypothetical protein